jgi:hypothetical protein
LKPTATPLLQNTVHAIATGGTVHFCTSHLPVKNKQHAIPPITIRNPNGSIMYSTHTAELDVPGLPPAGHHIHIVPALESQSLILMGQLCNAGCTVAFDAITVTVQYNKQPVLTGTRTSHTRLWHLEMPNNGHSPLPPSLASTHQANATIGSATPEQLVAFAHAALFSPALSALATALNKGYQTNFP